MRRVYASYQYRDGWVVSFLEEDLRTPLRRKCRFRDECKLFEMVERGGGFRDQEHRQMVEHGISMGRGGIYLTLTGEQYRRLL